jgi:hypothetical protein
MRGCQPPSFPPSLPFHFHFPPLLTNTKRVLPPFFMFFSAPLCINHKCYATALPLFSTFSPFFPPLPPALPPSLPPCLPVSSSSTTPLRQGRACVYSYSPVGGREGGGEGGKVRGGGLWKEGERKLRGEGEKARRTSKPETRREEGREGGNQTYPPPYLAYAPEWRSTTGSSGWGHRRSG